MALDKVKKVVLSHVPKSGLVGVAVSGGSDSMCLIDCILRHSLIEKDRLLIINFDHGLRGEESERDSAFVAQFAQTHGVKLHFEKLSVSAKSKAYGESLETTARALRREAFERIMEGGVLVILTAHTASDRVETLLMRLFRGTGIKGLAGMSEKDGFIVRPLIHCNKSEIIQYVKSSNVPYVEDSTNVDSAYSRNFIRNEVLPLIRTKYPKADEAILRLADLASQSAVRSDGVIIQGESAVVTEKSGDAVVSAFAHAGLNDYASAHVGAVTQLFEKPNGKGVDLPHGYRAEKEKAGVRVYKDFTPPEFEIPLLMGEMTLGRIAFKAESVAPRVDKASTVFDFDKLPDGVVVRSRKNGDRFTAVGGKEKSLSDWLIDKKVPRYERKNLAVLASGSEVLAVIGIATGEKIKIDENTVRAVEIKPIKGEQHAKIHTDLHSERNYRKSKRDGQTDK